MKFDLPKDQASIIKVIGVGGGGSNAVNYMYSQGITGVDFMICNTDAQALEQSPIPNKIQLGVTLTEGLGAGADPEVGKNAAIEDVEAIKKVLENNTKMVFITAGMGGGTGTGAAPVIAKVARELGILTVAVVTKPFPFEGRRRARVAEDGVKELRENVDSLITVPNERLLPVLGKNISLLKAFGEANNVLFNAVQGITDLIMRPGLINVDFADVRTVMSEMGMAMMGTGSASGEDRARVAAEAAIHNPLLEDINLRGARGVLVNITANEEVGLSEFTEVGSIIEEYASEDATVVIGCAIDPSVGDEMRVTVVATGLEGRPAVEVKSAVGESVVSQPVMAKVEQVVESNSDVAAAVVQPASKPTPSVKVEKVEKNSDGKKESVDSASISGGDKLSYLDIPAFLRRQAD